MRTKITAELLVSVNSLSNSLKWHEQQFLRFIDMLKSLENESQQKLLILITESFINISASEYHVELRSLLHKISKRLNKIDNLIIAPVEKVEHENTNIVNSSNFLSYLAKSKEYVFDIYSKNSFKTVIVNNSLEANKKYNKFNYSVIVLLDDFIGSGDTALDCINKYYDEVNKKDILIASIICMKEGYNNISDKNYSIIYNYIEEKGLREKCIRKLTSYGKTVEEIELEINELTRILMKKKYNNFLGYGNSEALVSMLRTPNNTIGLYWAKPGKKATYRPLYPRWENE